MGNCDRDGVAGVYGWHVRDRRSAAVLDSGVLIIDRAAALRRLSNGPRPQPAVPDRSGVPLRVSSAPVAIDPERD